MSDWHRITNLQTAKAEILTSTKYGRPFVDTDGGLERLDLVDRPWRAVLDFGCGVGRNIPGLLARGGDVTGYDFPNMVSMAREYLGDDYERVTWVEPPASNLAGRRFDLVVATLVFQHIHRDEIGDVLRVLYDTLQPDGRLYVASRMWRDCDHGSVWPSILERFAPVTPLDERHDEEMHQHVVFRCREVAL
jgi:SAM-dependent methyltransferase